MELIFIFITLSIFSSSTYGRTFDDVISVNPKTTAIDFSRGVPGSEEGTICVERMKYVDKTETNQQKECWVQNVTQCHYTYVTEYTDSQTEKCEDFYWKTCKIVFKEKAFNHTSKICKRSPVKQCDDGLVQQQSNPEIICETFFETECNTTEIIPGPGDEPLPITFCDKFPKKICAPNNCRIVEGPEECQETFSETTVEQPRELCHLQPQKHCSVISTSVPSLRPEKKCREIEKEICHTRLIDGNEIREPVFIKYCTMKADLQTSYVSPSSPPQESYGVPMYVPEHYPVSNQEKYAPTPSFSYNAVTPEEPFLHINQNSDFPPPLSYESQRIKREQESSQNTRINSPTNSKEKNLISKRSGTPNNIFDRLRSFLPV